MKQMQWEQFQMPVAETFLKFIHLKQWGSDVGQASEASAAF
jgi:hypothetical protein